MPILDGYETACTIRSNKRNPNWNVPIVALSALNTDYHRRKFLTSGFSDALPNPIHIEELSAKILKWIQVPQATESAQSSQNPIDRSEEIVDLEKLTEVFAGDMDEVMSLARNLSAFLEGEMNFLRMTVRRGIDIKLMRAKAETIQESADGFFAKALGDAAADFSRACAKNNLLLARRLFRAIEREHDKLQYALKEIQD